MSQEGTIELVFHELSNVLARLSGRLTPETAPAFFGELGIPMSSAQAASIAAPLKEVASGLTQLANLRAELDVAISTDDSGVSLKSVGALKGLVELIDGFVDFAQAIGGLSLPGVTPAVISALPERLFNLLLVDYLGRVKGVAETLEFAGILERTDFNVDATDPNLPFFTINTLHLDRIGGWIGKPALQLQQLYGWGPPGFDGTKLLPVLD